MKCPSCGKEVPEGKKFCCYCGTDFKVVKEEFKTVKVSKKNESKSALKDKLLKTGGLPKGSKKIKKFSWKEYYRPSILIAIWWVAASFLFGLAEIFFYHVMSKFTTFLLLFFIYMSVTSIWINSKLKNRYQELKKEIPVIVLIWVGLVMLDFLVYSIYYNDYTIVLIKITPVLAFFASLITLHLINRS
jgi:hypothetical protein